MFAKIKAMLKNKRFWAALALAAGLAGGAVKPEVVIAVGEAVGSIIEATEQPVVEPMPVQLAP